MSGPKYVVGAPAWDRDWSLPLWFESVTANCPPDQTGLAFVIPATDEHTREVINELAKPFAFLHVERDRGAQALRETRASDFHATLATARNQILRQANQVRPELFVMWDTDLLLQPGTVEAIESEDLPISTVWTWLNRQKPREVKHVDPSTKTTRRVLVQEPMAATAMRWEKPAMPVHLEGGNWDRHAYGLWRCDVALAVTAMRRSVYGQFKYGPNAYGEEIPFNWALHRASVPRYCWADSLGLHLYRRDSDELDLGWPGIMELTQQKPLACMWSGKRDSLDEALGFYDLKGQTFEWQSKGSSAANGTQIPAALHTE